MSELTITVIRLGFLAVLWLFVLTTVSVMRSDLFGTRPVGARPVPVPPPPRQPKQKGASRKKGARLPGMAEWAADEAQPWQTVAFDRYGLHATLAIKARRKRSRSLPSA